MDWDTALREDNGHVNPLGLFDLDRKIRPVGEAYRKLIDDWRDVLPAQSVCLIVPLVMPDATDEPWAIERREALRNQRKVRPSSEPKQTISINPAPGRTRLVSASSFPPAGIHLPG